MIKQKTPKTRNAGTMTESAFWSWIRSALRKASMYWKPISQCKNNSRRPYKGALKRQKWEYQCNSCKKWNKGTEVVVDHIKPAGTLKKAEDLPKFVETLFCEVDNLQTLCKKCHDAKSAEEKINGAYENK